MKITQLKNGRQERPYGDHIWKWYIYTDKPEEEVLAYCRQNLKNAERDEKTYWQDLRDSSKSFDEHMEVICGGYFTINKIIDGYSYRVVREYID